MKRKSLALVPALLVLLLVGLAAQQPDADALQAVLEHVRPGSDDWQTEVRQVQARQRLAELAVWMQDGAQGDPPPALLAPAARATVLRPSRLRAHNLAGGLRALTWQPLLGKPGQSLLSALRDLLSHLPGEGRRLAFKITGTTAREAGGFETRVRYEGFAKDRGQACQQTATWKVIWEASQDHQLPRLRLVQLLTFQEVWRGRAAFVDCTASVLRGQTAARADLALGCEWWNGRLDSVGELNLMGHQGLAVGDVNGDGREDLYVAQGTGLPNKLFVHQPDGTLKDVAQEAGVAWLDDTKGVLFADMDNDGDQDLLCALGPVIVICKNSGTGVFRRFVSLRAPTPAAFYSLAVADYDQDGDLDIYGCRYVALRYGVSVPLPLSDANNGPTNHLLRNDGADTYVDVTFKTGLAQNNARFSLAASWADYDGDGDPDLYVANDFGRNNLYRNDHGHFVDVAAQAGVEDQAAGMGVSFADFDLDGDLDLYVTNMFSAAGQRIVYQPRFQQDATPGQRLGLQRQTLGNSLLVNQGDGTFREQGQQAGVRMGRWGFGARFVDLNNDGLDDIVAPNGFLTGRVKDDL